MHNLWVFCAEQQEDLGTPVMCQLICPSSPEVGSLSTRSPRGAGVSIVDIVSIVVAIGFHLSGSPHPVSGRSWTHIIITALVIHLRDVFPCSLRYHVSIWWDGDVTRTYLGPEGGCTTLLACYPCYCHCCQHCCCCCYCGLVPA
jgi:hypothetical protein